MRCVVVLLRVNLRHAVGRKSMWWNGFDGAFPSKKVNSASSGPCFRRATKLRVGGW